jgi:hypothetical protein
MHANKLAPARNQDGPFEDDLSNPRAQPGQLGPEQKRFTLLTRKSTGVQVTSIS